MSSTDPTPTTADDEVLVEQYIAEGYERDVAEWLVDVDRGRTISPISLM